MELRQTTVTLPDFTKVTIRETNGEDDDVISKISDSKDNQAALKFLSSIIVEPKTSVTDVAAWPLNKKYYLLLKSRIHSLGNILKFKYAWPDETTKDLVDTNYVEDLSKYDTDLEALSLMDEAKQKEAIEKLTPYQIKPFPFRELKEIMVKLDNGREIKFNLMDTESENKSIGTDLEEFSINDELRLRKFSTKDDTGAWVEVQNFRPFSSREMAAIRKVVREADPQFLMPMDIENPKTKERTQVPLIRLADFFFPTDI
jgi:hypothetical protein